MEVVVEIIRLILSDYFGWDEDEIAELWRRQPGRKGSVVRRIGSGLPSRPKLFTKRSIVREIGSRLPLRPIKRPYFQITGSSMGNKTFDDIGDVSNHDESMSHMMIPSFSDIDWIIGPSYYDDDDASSCIGSDLADDSSTCDLLSLDEGTDEELEAVCANKLELLITQPQNSEIQTDNSAAMQKISALEEELNRLRAQIATLVAAPTGTPAFTPLPLISIPCTPGAPPPPPPPPPPTPHSTPMKSVQDIIKEKRSRRMTIAGTLELPPSVPNMSDVLKGLDTVKLKSVQRSPGGTPLRIKPLATEGMDPASIIARALKKKFAHRRRISDAHSPRMADKENMSSFTPSPPNSPQKPAFGPHLLKPTKGRRRSNLDFRRRSQTSPLVEVCI